MKIHSLDDEMINSLITMINSGNEHDVRIGLEILNNTKQESLTDNTINKLIKECSGLYNSTVKGDDIFVSSFYFNNGKMFMGRDGINHDSSAITMYNDQNDLNY